MRYNADIPEHGGAYSTNVLDFSANLNPLGMPDCVQKELSRTVGDWERYPDPNCTELTKRLSERLDATTESIVCGNGAADLIYRIIGAVRPKRALIAAPCFSEYGKALSESGAETEEYFLNEENGFALDGGLTDAVSTRLGEGDMLILASPNNPTGLVIPTELLRRICAECERRRVVFLCDECFLGFAENAASVRDFLNPYVISLSAFTKTYALAGLRLGYAVFGDERLCGTVRRRGQYWSVSSPAQTAGIAALNSGDYPGRSRRLIAKQREFLTDRLSELGIKVFRSDANFLLLKSEIPLYEPLRDRGIIIRKCANFSGLDERFYRIAVRTPSENERLIAEIRQMQRPGDR